MTLKHQSITILTPNMYFVLTSDLTTTNDLSQYATDDMFKAIKCRGANTMKSGTDHVLHHAPMGT